MGELDIPLYAGIGAIVFCFFCLGLYSRTLPLSLAAEPYLCCLLTGRTVILLPRVPILACWALFYALHRRREHGLERLEDMETATPGSSMQELVVPPPEYRAYRSLSFQSIFSQSLISYFFPLSSRTRA